MKAKWVVENYESDDSLQPLINEIKRQEKDLTIVKFEIYEDVNPLPYTPGDCVVFYGTLNLGRKLQKESAWVPGVYCNFQNMCCNTYYSYWAKYLLNSDYIMLPIMEIKRRKDDIFNEFGVDDCIFLRPNSGAKSFTGQILKKEEIERDFDLLGRYSGKDLDRIIAIISSPKVIQKEWRCVVVNGRVIAFSQYMSDGKLDVKMEIDADAYCLADKIAKEEWQPDNVYVLDICRSNDEYFLLEANSFSCSGLYDSDPEPIVREVSLAAEREYKEYIEV